MRVTWMIKMVRGLSFAATDEVIAGRVHAAEAGAMLGEILASAFAPAHAG